MSVSVRMCEPEGLVVLIYDPIFAPAASRGRAGDGGLGMSKYPGVSGSISSGQIRAARALLGWSQKDLGRAAGLSPAVVGRVERGSDVAHDEANFGKVADALDNAGIRFLRSRVDPMIGVAFVGDHAAPN